MSYNSTAKEFIKTKKTYIHNIIYSIYVRILNTLPITSRKNKNKLRLKKHYCYDS